VTTPAFPPGRYGRRRAGRRWPRWVPQVLLAVVILAAVVLAFDLYRRWTADAVHTQVLAFDVTSDTAVSVRFELVKKAGDGARCVLRARARDGAEVGRTELVLPVDQRTLVQVTQVVATSRRAVTGEVVGCRPTGR